MTETITKTGRIGVDLGGTKTEVALLDSSDNVILRKRKPTPASEGYEAILDVVVSLVKDTREEAGTECTIGIGIPGILDLETDLVLNANTTVMIGHPLRKDLEKRLEQAVRIENDANCFALAEATMGAGRPYGTIFGVIMGTGCGGGIVIQKKLHSGRQGIAGEWGHASIDPQGPECWCGNRGCIETLISGGGLQKRFLAEYGQRRSVPEIAEEARRGKGPCKEFYEQFLDDYGRALGGLISILDPDAVIMGGGLSNLPELYEEGRQRMLKHTF
ncbi:MAG: ROK family protein, partial [Leptospiraceae bacterium]|nr:ROK family protein [Leptospiraceae bacterium]